MKYLMLIGFLLAAFSLHAQAPYTGGEGDGYARVSLEISNTQPPTEFQFDIARTTVGNETVFEIRLNGLQTTPQLEVFDAAGRRVQQWQGEGADAVTIEFTTHNWASGAYLFRLSANDQFFVKKVIHASQGGN